MAQAGQHRHGEHRGHVGADAHEPGVAHGEFAHVAVHQIEGERQDHVYPHVHEDLDDVGVEGAGGGQTPGQGQYEGLAPSQRRVFF